MAYICEKKIKCENCEHFRYDEEHGEKCCWAEIDEKQTAAAEKLIPLYTIGEANAKLHISKGNEKIGKDIYSFSTLPGSKDHLLFAAGQLLTDIPGTCGEYCEECFDGGCYACNSARQYHNSCIPAWAENTLLLRSGRVWELLEDYLAKKNKKEVKVKYFRINVSGEMLSVSDVENWNTLAKNHPKTVFCVYTKNYDALEDFLKAHPEGSEKNFVINVSQWHGCADDFLQRVKKNYPKAVFNVYEYDDTFLKENKLSEGDKKRLASMRHCPGIDKKGHHVKRPSGEPFTCSDCHGFCYEKTGKETAVYAH